MKRKQIKKAAKLMISSPLPAKLRRMVERELPKIEPKLAEAFKGTK